MQRQLDKNLLHALLKPNTRIQNKPNKKLLSLRSLAVLIQTLKKLFANTFGDGDTFLWLNNKVRYNRRHFRH